MNKYIYYNGKIYEISKLDHHTLYRYVVSPYGNKDIFEEYYINDNRVSYLVEDGKAKWFDRFEDLIEVGDIIEGDIIEFAVDFDYDVKSEVLDFQIIGEDDRKVINVFLDKVNYQSVKSIWKPVNNAFVRVCHKENGSWVID